MPDDERAPALVSEIETGLRSLALAKEHLLGVSSQQPDAPEEPVRFADPEMGMRALRLAVRLRSADGMEAGFGQAGTKIVNYVSEALQNVQAQAELLQGGKARYRRGLLFDMQLNMAVIKAARAMSRMAGEIELFCSSCRRELALLERCQKRQDA